MCLSHSKCDKASLPHALAYSVFASSPHSSPGTKAFLCLTLSLQTWFFFATYGRYFSHLVDTSCWSVRYFQLWWQLLPTTMDCTCRQLYLRWADSYLYVGYIMPGLGEKGWPSQVWYFLNSSQYCISVFCKHGHVLCEMHFKTLLLSLIVQNYMSIRLRIRPLSSSRLSWDEKNLVFIVVLILPSLIIF